jgi:molybdopterin-guanine dinucleotide biosynthesis protein MobB
MKDEVAAPLLRFDRREGQSMKQIPAVAIVGNSGAGKTTLLERLIPALKQRGLRVGVIKHDAHRFDIDHPGKDSHRLTAAGADTMMITSGEKMAMVKRHAASPPIEELLERYFSEVNLVLVEGFRGSSLPKIEVHRKEFRSALICRGERNDPGLAAVASDEPLDLDVPVLDLNDPVAIARFIVSFLSEIDGKPYK